ncbi:MAG: hypothetical protein AAFS10_02570 [Myxococcota bacterium]
MKLHALSFLTAGLIVGLIVAAAFSSALAENSELDSDPRVIPYNGVLELDGAAYNGEADFRFAIVTEEGNDCSFVEEQGDVVVYSGRFNVNLGSTTGAGVDGCIFNSQEVYITIGVRDSASDGEYTELSGRQRIRPVPFSYWSAEGSDFKVDNTLNVGGLANLNGGANITGRTDITNGALYINTNIDVGDTTDGSLIIGSAEQLRIDGNEMQAFDSSGNTSFLALQALGDEVRLGGALAVRGNIYNDDGDVVTVQDQLVVTNGLELTGNITSSGDRIVISEDVAVSGNLDVRGNIFDGNSTTLTLNDDVTVNGQLNIADVDTTETEFNGCMRVDAVQICWGVANMAAGSATATLSKAFSTASGSRAVHMTATAEGLGTFVTGECARDACTFRGYNAVQNSAAFATGRIHYTAIGPALDSEW